MAQEPWTLSWGRDHRPRPVGDAEALRQLLDQASRDAEESFTMAELRSPDGVSCVVGLGRPRSVVTFNESFAEPPFYLSRGSGMEGENLVFFFNGHWTEFEPDAAVPTSDAIRAIEEFFETGERPSVVQWDEA